MLRVVIYAAWSDSHCETKNKQDSVYPRFNIQTSPTNVALTLDTQTQTLRFARFKSLTLPHGFIFI